MNYIESLKDTLKIIPSHLMIRDLKAYLSQSSNEPIMDCNFPSLSPNNLKILNFWGSSKDIIEDLILENNRLKTQLEDQDKMLLDLLQDSKAYQLGVEAGRRGISSIQKLRQCRNNQTLDTSNKALEKMQLDEDFKVWKLIQYPLDFDEGG